MVCVYPNQLAINLIQNQNAVRRLGRLNRSDVQKLASLQNKFIQ